MRDCPQCQQPTLSVGRLCFSTRQTCAKCGTRVRLGTGAEFVRLLALELLVPVGFLVTLGFGLAGFAVAAPVIGLVLWLFARYGPLRVLTAAEVERSRIYAAIVIGVLIAGVIWAHGQRQDVCARHPHAVSCR